MKTNGKASHVIGEEVLTELKEAGKDLMDEASDVLKKKTTELREKGLTQTVKENPIKTMLIGVGIGLLLAYLFTRKKK